jgi:quinoprotein glucose dehydrogenase
MYRINMRKFALAILLIAEVSSALGWVGCAPRATVRDPAAPVVEWPNYGNDPGSSRYSPLTEINKSNVANLRVAWTYRTGDVSDGTSIWNGKLVKSRSTFEATPLMVDDTLYVITPFSRIIALDPETGTQKWVFDPKIDRIGDYGDAFTSRGLALRIDPKLQPGQPCRKMLYEATLDGRLIAVDGDTGTPCAEFGTDGQVDLKAGINLKTKVDWDNKGEYHFTSAPAVVGDVVVVGSAINDNNRVEMPSGQVRGYNARTGALMWSFDPIPRDPADPARAGWRNGADRTGAANVWGPISADPEHDLVFLPTTSPSPDYYGGERQGDNRYADSLVVLHASTGKILWTFQAVHHNLWDYDLPSAPSLIDLERNGQRIAALAQPSKMGFLFILDRDTGQPLFPIEERSVPQNGVPGEWLSPTQPFPVVTPPLAPNHLDPQDAWGLTPWDRRKCSEQIANLRHDGIFTPPSFQGSLVYPGIAGGTNWGGVSFDRSRGLIVVNQINMVFVAQLIPRAEMSGWKTHAGGEEDGWEYAPMRGTPYVMRRKPLLSPLGLPCNAPPWGTLAAVDANTGKIRWQVPLGTLRELAPVPLPIGWGTPTLGGSLTTASGLTFIGATPDRTFRAFDTETGRELWHVGLPVSAIATPVTYRSRIGGRQFVVVAAGGHAKIHGIKLGDYVIAYALQ